MPRRTLTPNYIGLAGQEGRVGRVVAMLIAADDDDVPRHGHRPPNRVQPAGSGAIRVAVWVQVPPINSHM